MILRINDLDTCIEFKENIIIVLNISNKKLFYDVVSSLFRISEGDYKNEIVNFFDTNNEINLSKKLICYIDYFNIEYNSKNVLTKLYERINNELTEKDKSSLQLMINDIIKMYNNYISNIDLDLTYNDTISFVDLCKLLKLRILDDKDNILDKILLIIDIESQLHINKIIVFINLNQYINENDRKIIYEYIIAKKINVLFIENNLSRLNIKDEIIYNIDNDFDEYITGNL